MVYSAGHKYRWHLFWSRSLLDSPHKIAHEKQRIVSVELQNIFLRLFISQDWQAWHNLDPSAEHASFIDVIKTCSMNLTATCYAYFVVSLLFCNENMF